MRVWVPHRLVSIALLCSENHPRGWVDKGACGVLGNQRVTVSVTVWLNGPAFNLRFCIIPLVYPSAQFLHNTLGLPIQYALFKIFSS